MESVSLAFLRKNPPNRMFTFNKILLLGHLTGDPEQKTTANSKALTTFGVATNHRFSTPDGKTDQRTCFVDVTTWGTLADTCAATLKKGHLVFIEGRLELSRWEKEEVTYSKLFVQATTVVFLSPLEKKSPSPSKATVAPSLEKISSSPLRESPRPNDASI